MHEKISIGTLTFNGKHRLIIEALLEFPQGFVKDVVFIEMQLNQKQEEVIRMQLRIFDLYTIVYGLEELFEIAKELISNGGEKQKGYYENRTYSSKFQTTLFFGVKIDNHKKGEALPVFYINMYRNKQLYSIGFNHYEIRAMVDRIKVLREVFEKRLFLAQENKKGKK